MAENKEKKTEKKPRAATVKETTKVVIQQQHKDGDGVWVDTHLGDVLAEHTGPSKQLTKDFLEVVKGGKDVGTFRCIIVVGAPVVAKAVQKTLIELT